MINCLNIEGLRGISKCQIDDLGQFNVFVGCNNCGKSTILDSVFLLSGGSIPLNFQKINELRNCSLREGTDFMYNFYGLNIANPIKISAMVDGGERRLEIMYSENEKRNLDIDDLRQGVNKSVPMIYRVDFNMQLETGESVKTYMSIHSDEPGKLRQKSAVGSVIVPAWYISPAEPYENVVEYFAKVVEMKQESEIAAVMREIEPSIQDIVIAGDRILVDSGFEKRLPIQLMGDGLKKLLSVIVNMSMASEGILLVDEIDNGLHYKSMPVMWKAIIQSAMQYNVQVFVTTHNKESMNSLNDILESFPDVQSRFRSYSICRKGNGEHVAIMANYEQYNHIINQGLELR